jgi:hypothetical protein
MVKHFCRVKAVVFKYVLFVDLKVKIATLRAFTQGSRNNSNMKKGCPTKVGGVNLLRKNYS